MSFQYDDGHTGFEKMRFGELLIDDLFFYNIQTVFTMIIFDRLFWPNLLIFVLWQSSLRMSILFFHLILSVKDEQYDPDIEKRISAATMEGAVLHVSLHRPDIRREEPQLQAKSCQMIDSNQQMHTTNTALQIGIQQYDWTMSKRLVVCLNRSATVLRMWAHWACACSSSQCIDCQ